MKTFLEKVAVKTESFSVLLQALILQVDNIGRNRKSLLKKLKAKKRRRL